MRSQTSTQIAIKLSNININFSVFYLPYGKNIQISCLIEKKQIIHARNRCNVTKFKRNKDKEYDRKRQLPKDYLKVEEVGRNNLKLVKAQEYISPLDHNYTDPTYIDLKRAQIEYMQLKDMNFQLMDHEI